MMKAYKGFNTDMTCRGFQYEEGKEYEAEGDMELCHNGFHACEDPLDCLWYYGPAHSVYHEVELDGVSDERDNDDTKVVAKRIRVGARVSIAGMVEACIWFRFSKTTSKKDRNSSDYGAASAIGDKGAASATGYKGAASATGDYGAASATGCRGVASATGDDSAASATGDDSVASATGYRGVASVEGADSIACALGYNCKAKGALGDWLILAEREEPIWSEENRKYECPMKTVKAFKVDGETVKPDTWYVLEDGKLKEAEQDKI